MEPKRRQFRYPIINGRMEALLKVRKIGKVAGIVLPEKVLAHLRVQIGDSLEVETTSDGILLRALPMT